MEWRPIPINNRLTWTCITLTRLSSYFFKDTLTIFNPRKKPYETEHLLSLFNKLVNQGMEILIKVSRMNLQQRSKPREPGSEACIHDPLSFLPGLTYSV